LAAKRARRFHVPALRDEGRVEGCPEQDTRWRSPLARTPHRWRVEADLPAQERRGKLHRRDRIRGWRLVLEPRQSAAEITQERPACGSRDGGDLVESVPGQPDRACSTRRLFLAGCRHERAVSNIGTTTLIRRV